MKEEKGKVKEEKGKVKDREEIFMQVCENRMKFSLR